MTRQCKGIRKLAKKTHGLAARGLGALVALSPCFLSGISAQAEDSGLKIDWSVFGDVRAYHVNGERGWFTDWLGKSRYGENKDRQAQTKLDLAEISVMADISYGWDWSAFVHGIYAKEDGNAGKGVNVGGLDLVEGYVQYKPAPKGRLSLSGRFGLMFPHISRENVGAAWSSPYSITPSAINSWIGEEVRTFGAEITAKQRFDHSDLSLTVSAFGLNDTAGALLHFRGWAFGDYKAGAFSRLPLPKIPALYGRGQAGDVGHIDALFPEQALRTNPIVELDDKVGWYASADWTNRQGLKLGAFYYDNRGEPSALSQGQYGWRTKFYNLYADYAIGDWTLISQVMGGTTKMGLRALDSDGTGQWDYPANSKFESAFILASRQWDQWRVSARVDGFRVKDRSFIFEDNNNEKGWSTMMAAQYQLSDNFTLISEWMHIVNRRPVRAQIALPVKTTVDQILLSVRFQF